MKPSTSIVMRGMIKQVREAFPFSLTADELCSETCSHGCPLKLLEFMDSELIDWDARLDAGEVPTFGDIRKLEKTSRRIYTVLAKNKLVAPTHDGVA